VVNRAGSQVATRSVELPGPFRDGGHGLDQIAMPGGNFPGMLWSPDGNGERMLIAFNWFKPEEPDVAGKVEDTGSKSKAKVQMMCIIKAVFPKPATP